MSVITEPNPAPDYAASNVSELASRHRIGAESAAAATRPAADPTTRIIARRLLSACIVVPAVLWLSMLVGIRLNWYGLVTCSILFVCSVTVVFGVIVWFNVTKLARLDVQRAEAQEQMKRAKEAAEAANRFRSMFFANISHEIRTPLTAINGFAELLLNPDRTGEQRLADARVIRRNGEHLLTLINDILDLSRIEAGKMAVERILCSPAGIIGDVCAMLRPRAADKGLTLDVAFSGPIPQRIQTDPTRLRQVLINLVSNAIKFTKTGGVKLEVSIQPSLRAVKPLLEVKITDTGIGIPLDQQATLFQPFVQADTTITRQYGGSGLGLAISQHFARALGGDITLISEPGCGSAFTVTVGAGSLDEAEILNDPQQALHAQEQFENARVRISGSVLVAEDGLDNQQLIQTKLRETGLNVEVVSNGKLACEKALSAAMKGKPFDIILMDVQMPVMDGFSATLELRGKGYRGPVIALTANAMERDRSKLLGAGCNDFVTKPIQMRDLFKAIGRYLKVVEAVDEPKLTKDEEGAAANRAVLVERFFSSLPSELAQIELAIQRESRVQLEEIVRLLLGQASAAGLKDLAPSLAKLVFTVERERSTVALRQAVAEFAREAQPRPQTQAA